MGVSRREFSTRVGLALTGVVVNDLGIFKLLAPPKEPVNPSFQVDWKIGHHTIPPGSVNGHVFILGETALRLLHDWNYLQKVGAKDFLAQFTQTENPATLGQKFIDPSTAVSNYDFYAEAFELAQAQKQKAQLVVTDARHYLSVNPDDMHRRIIGTYNTNDRVQLIALAIGGVSGLTYLAKNTVPKLNSIFGKNKILESVAIGSLGYLIGTSRTMAKPVLQTLGFKAEDINQLYDFIDAIGDEEKSLFFRLVRIRSLSMALNTHYTLALIDQLPNLRSELPKNNHGNIDVLFFAGGGHADAKADFALDSQTINSELTSHADHIIDYFAQKISDELLKPTQNIAELQNLLTDWILSTSGFSIPVPAFTAHPDFQNPGRRDLPDTPRAILYQRLQKKYLSALYKSNQNPDDQTFKKTANSLGEMIRWVMQEDISFYYDTQSPQMRQMSDRAAAIRTDKDILVGLNIGDIKAILFEGIPYIPEPPGIQFSPATTELRTPALI